MTDPNPPAPHPPGPSPNPTPAATPGYAAVRLSEKGRYHVPSDLLVPIYGWFTEGLDTPVLQDAKALLDQLV